MRDPYEDIKSDLFYMAATAFYIIAVFLAVAGVLIGIILSAPNARSQEMVDVALVLAVDHSSSVDAAEWDLQMEGYAAAFESDAVQQSIWAGAHQRIAVTMFRWSDDYAQEELVPWRIIDSPEAASALAAEIRGRRGLKEMTGTCISGAMLYAKDLFEDLPFEADRMVLDVSGDEQGRCTHHPYYPGEVRDELVKFGVTINGLPIITETPQSDWGLGYNSNTDLKRFYTIHVIGGPGAFVIASLGFGDFGQAVHRKLLLEIALLSPIPGARP